MTKYILRRLLQIIPMVVIMATISFLLIRLAPGDPAMVLAGEDANPTYIEAVRVKYGLDQPLHVQLWRYLSRLVQGDLGQSMSMRLPVAQLVRDRLPNTLILVLSGHSLAIVAGAILGTYAAYRRGSWPDLLLCAVSSALYSVPVFWSGLILVLLFAVTLGWLPTSGMMSIGQTCTGFEHLLDVLRHLILPVATLALAEWPPYFQIMRTSVAEVMGSDYIKVARAKGLGEPKVLYRHGLRNALLPTVSLGGLQIGKSFAGAILVETVFGWPGMGGLAFTAIFTRDYPILMGVFIVVSIAVLVMNLVTDLAYAALDPRVVYC
ncbi:MAG TPA: ABC transporter permease [Anaerolineae bacterium]|nr:ABC transporter permease [Anaerolineae bacterium]HPL28978.1 ABC transporter permease [Anaerolineae bacterium]